MRLLSKSLLCALLGLALVGNISNALAQSQIGGDDPPPEGTAPPTWSGGPGSLPYGPLITTPQIVDAARTMPAVQVAIAQMLAAGCSRRWDLDAAYNGSGGSTAVIAFEFPGTDVRIRQPFILILTRPGTDAYSTQVFGMSWVTGADSLPVADTSAPMANFCVAMVGTNGETLGPFAVVPNSQGEVTAGFRTAYDTYNAVQPGGPLSQKFTALGNFTDASLVLLGYMAIGAVGNGIAGIPGGPAGVGWGAVGGAVAGALTWWWLGPGHMPQYVVPTTQSSWGRLKTLYR